MISEEDLLDGAAIPEGPGATGGALLLLLPLGAARKNGAIPA